MDVAELDKLQNTRQTKIFMVAFIHVSCFKSSFFKGLCDWWIRWNQGCYRRRWLLKLLLLDFLIHMDSIWLTWLLFFGETQNQLWQRFWTALNAPQSFVAKWNHWLCETFNDWQHRTWCSTFSSFRWPCLVQHLHELAVEILEKIWNKTEKLVEISSESE